MQIVAKVPAGKVPTGKVPGIKAPVKFFGSVLLSCPRLAKDLLVLPDRLQRCGGYRSVAYRLFYYLCLC